MCGVDLTPVAVELLDRLPANRTLGLTVAEAVDGVGRVVMPVSDAVHNVIAALHSSGVAALADAAALAAALSRKPRPVDCSRSAPTPASRFSARSAEPHSLPAI